MTRRNWILISLSIFVGLLVSVAVFNSLKTNPTGTDHSTLATSTNPAVIAIEAELPRDVFEVFTSDFYSGCPRPALEELRVQQVWSGSADTTITVNPPIGSYFLIVETSMEAQTWGFDSTYETSGEKFQAIRLVSTASSEKSGAQLWCSSGGRYPATGTLRVNSTGLS